jgi:hypothetical protein
MSEIKPTHDGYERLKDDVPTKDDSGTDDFPTADVTVTVHRDDRPDWTGTLLHYSGSLTQDDDERETHRYNGYFLKLRQSDGTHVNVYGSPDTGGATTLKTEGWEGRGGTRYKYKISGVSVDIDHDSDPRCPKCDSEMVFGYSNERNNRVPDADGSRGRYVSGWLCEECLPGRVTTCDQLP